ncbi:MAG: LPS assembly lipoprotein LptE [Bacteroidota bacterium]|nr:LPS assembly lipoprotein LptE [Bacteroidota bacterium]
MERAVKIFLFFSISLVCYSCGVYGFRGNNPPEGINSIAIPTFIDVSGFSAPTLAENFTQRLKDKIISDNTFRVADKNIADAVLNGTITNVTDEALVISSGDNVPEDVSRRKITITVNVSFDNLKKQKNIWNKNFVNYGEYRSSNNSFSERSEGTELAVMRITEDILIDLTSNW